MREKKKKKQKEKEENEEEKKIIINNKKKLSRLLALSKYVQYYTILRMLPRQVTISTSSCRLQFNAMQDKCANCISVKHTMTCIVQI